MVYILPSTTIVVKYNQADFSPKKRKRGMNVGYFHLY